MTRDRLGHTSDDGEYHGLGDSSMGRSSIHGDIDEMEMLPVSTSPRWKDSMSGMGVAGHWVECDEGYIYIYILVRYT